MARKNAAAAQDPADPADPNATAAAANREAVAVAKPPRKPVNPNETLSFDKDQDGVLIATLLDNPGHYTTKALAKALAQHPAFVNMTARLATDRAPEKLRQRIKRLSKYSESQYGKALELKKSRNAGYDSTDTLDEVFRSRGIGRVAASVVAPSTNVAPAPQAGPAVPQQPATGLVTGGLIPVPQG